MAIRFRQQRGRWEVYWRNPYTSRLQSASFKEQADAEKHDAFIKYKLAWEKEYFMPAKAEEKRIDDSLEAVYFAYLTEKQFNAKKMKWQLTAMKIPLERIGRKRISAITTADLAGVLAAHTASGIKTVTARGRMQVLFTVLRWAKKRGHLATLPDFPELPKGHYKPIDIPTQAEVQAMLQVAPPHLRRIIIIAASTGIRVGPSELFKLRWQDVDLARAVIRVQAAAKNPKEPVREIPIRSDLLDLFQQWKAEDDMRGGVEYVCHYKGKRIETINVAWGHCLQKAGVRRLAPYSLRHLFATEAIAAGADIGTVAKLLGHASPTMILMHYQHVLTRQKKAAVEALPSLVQYGQACMGKKNPVPLQ